MAENSDQSRKTAPSLMARASNETEEEGSGTRILAGLQGRLPVHAASTRRRSHTKRYILILLVLLLLIGAGSIAFMIAGNEKSAPPVTIAKASEMSHSDTKTEMNSHEYVATRNRVSSPADAPVRSATIVDAPPPLGASDPSSHDASSGGPGATGAASPGSETNVGGKASDPIGEIISASQADPAVGDANATLLPARAPHDDSDTRIASSSGSDPHRSAASHGATQAPAKISAEASGKTAGKASPHTKHAGARNDTDVALLTVLLSQGLPSPTPAHGKSASPKAIDTAQALPGSSLSERLKACRQLSWLSGERCRLDVCSGHWGIAAECPSVQAQTEQ